jgi:4-hydroxybenzoate polyprenyltransferase
MSQPMLQSHPVSAVYRVVGLIECMRPAQWIKNGFVLAVLVFASRLTDPTAVRHALAAFAAFCLVASGTYLWNDMLDREADRAHPEKQHRPIASGRLSPVVASVAGSIFLVSGAWTAFLVNRPTGLVLLTYMMMNILYVFWLKHMAILDVMCIALGFVLRVMAGASAVDVTASHWLLLCTFLLALFLGVAKRRNEIATLADGKGKHRKVLNQYSIEWLDQAGTVLSGAAIVSYALYTVAPETQARFHTDSLIYTVPFVVYGILRYLHLTHFSSVSGNPTAALTGDKSLMLCVGAWLTTCALMIYR